MEETSRVGNKITLLSWKGSALKGSHPCYPNLHNGML